MLEVATFLAGFTTGWAVRATANSSRALVVGLIAQVHGAADRVRTVTAIERESLEDLLAEGKALYEARRRSKRPRTAPRDSHTSHTSGAEGVSVNDAGGHEGNGSGPAGNGHDSPRAGNLP